MNINRCSGILCHPTSFPGRFGVGTIGEMAYGFIDYLAKNKQTIWQLLPLNPTGYGDSPYQGLSAFAGNPLLIDVDQLVEEGFLLTTDIEDIPDFPTDKVDYGEVIPYKMGLLKTAYEKFVSEKKQIKRGFINFCKLHKKWLDDYALFMAIKNDKGGMPWYEWNDELKLRESSALRKARKSLAREIELQKFMQYLFFMQWTKVREFAKEKGMRIMGDIPLYVSHDSSDAWSHPEVFLFDKERNPVEVAGVPPDRFSNIGQLWGNPIYNWEKLQSTGFKWWIDRVTMNLELYDIIRIDHFRGLAGYWSIPYGEKTAINGEWIPAPGQKFFTKLRKKLGDLPIIAEDLGVITPDVDELRENFNFPGMKILHFAFDNDAENVYLPHNYGDNYIVYTGTHDNDTTLGWYLSLESQNKNFVNEYLPVSSDESISWALIRKAWASVAKFAMAPLQDVLELGSDARMNTPGSAAGNWQWRFHENDIDILENDRKLLRFTEIYGRSRTEEEEE